MRQYGKLNRYLPARPATHKPARKNGSGLYEGRPLNHGDTAIRIHRKTFVPAQSCCYTFSNSILRRDRSGAAGRALVLCEANIATRLGVQVRHRQRYSPGFLRLLYNHFAGHIRMNRTGV